MTMVKPSDQSRCFLKSDILLTDRIRPAGPERSQDAAKKAHLRQTAIACQAQFDPFALNFPGQFIKKEEHVEMQWKSS